METGTIPLVTAIVNPAALKAVLPFITKDETRENLLGLWMIRRGEYVTVYGTNGRILGAIRFPAEYGDRKDNVEVWMPLKVEDIPFFLPATVLKSALRGWKPNRYMTEQWSVVDMGEGRYELVTLTARIPFTNEQNDCPDLVRVIPHWNEGKVLKPCKHVCLDLEYSEAFLALKKYTGNSANPTIWNTSADGIGVLLVQYDNPNVLGIWMPCRTSGVYSWESWLTGKKDEAE